MTIRNLIPWSKRATGLAERDPFASLHEDMDQLLENFFGRPGGQAPMGRFWPAVDVSETDGEVRVKAELPGLEERDVDASIAEDVVTLKGEKKHEKEEKGEDTYRLERSYGSFRREIPLPCRVQVDKAKATFSKGVLTISAPKAADEAKKVRKIALKAE